MKLWKAQLVGALAFTGLPALLPPAALRAFTDLVDQVTDDVVQAALAAWPDEPEEAAA